MRGLRGVLIVLGAFVLLTGSSLDASALVDDFETDFWLPYTDFLLGDKASAGYASTFVRSGTRSFHVAISGYSILDFGSAYGYAVYATRGAPITELRVSLLYDRLQDVSPSFRDAYASGLALDLMDKDYRSLDRVRYITAYQASRIGSLCGPTKADIVLPPPAGLGAWTDLARDPAVDFPAARWQAAKFVRVSVGFLCTAGLRGAAYSLYFDDFMLDTGAGDTDGDGLSDLDEEARVYAMSVTSGSTPRMIPSAGTAAIDVIAPPVGGFVQWAGVGLEIHHPHSDNLSIEFVSADGSTPRSEVLWDPGFNVRGTAILEPRAGAALRGTVEVRGKAWRPNPIVHFYVDDARIAGGSGNPDGTFAIPWSTAGWSEGNHRLRVIVQAMDGGEFASRVGEEVPVIVDRTPPIAEVLRPAKGDLVRGLTVVEAGARDDRGLSEVDLRVDGIVTDVRREEPFTFFYETTNLVPGKHVFGIRAIDRAGNDIVRDVEVRVGLSSEGLPVPCIPVCNVGKTTSGNLPPIAAPRAPVTAPLASGDRLEVLEAFRAPWTAGIGRTGGDISLMLDAIKDSGPLSSDGLVRPTFGSADFLHVGHWRIVVRDHGKGESGFVQKARILVAARTSPALPDTDGDGLNDGLERSFGTVPVLPDTDADGLLDGAEVASRSVTFVVDGSSIARTIRTNPLVFDTDQDGLVDGLELLPGEGQSPSDPTDPDTDRDGLLDGVERNRYGSDPTRTDTDGDTLDDYSEVTPHPIALTIDEVSVVRSITTLPYSKDSDGDGLTDPQEWHGQSLYSYTTDPADDDTDDDGLSDGAEVTSLAGDLTIPVNRDSDHDGIIDGLDLAPVHAWNFPWSTVYETGLLRFDLDVHALGVHGIAAAVFNYNVFTGSCDFLADEVASATRSSDESMTSAINQMNRVFNDGGETTFRAISASTPELVGWGPAEFVYGACDFGHPKKYVITYTHDDHIYPVEFINVQPYSLRDDAHELFYHAIIDVPLNASRSQTIVIQAKIRADADRTSTTSTAPTVLPGLSYVLSNGRDFFNIRPFYRNLAVGAPLDEHVYEFTLRVPSSAVPPSNLFWKDGVLHATLVVTPLWLTIDGATRTKAAVNATAMTIGAAVVNVSEHAERLVVRLSHDVKAIQSVLPSSIAKYGTGYYNFGGYTVYVYRLETLFDEQSLTQADALYILGNGQEDIDAFQENAAWNPTWRMRAIDGFNNPGWVFKAVRFSLSFSRQLFDHVYDPVPDIVRSTLDEDRFNYGYITIERVRNLDTMTDEFVVSARFLKIGQTRYPHPEFPWITRTDEAILDEDAVSEIVDDPNKASVLADSRYAAIRTRLKGASAGVVAVIWGGQAILAYKDGEVIKGTVYLAAGAAGVLGIVKSDVVLVDAAFQGRYLSKGVTIKLGFAAAIATGGILAGYQLFLSTQTSDPIKKLSHYEAAAGTVADTAISLVPFYGPIFELSWVLTTVGIAALGPLLGYVPDSLALKIVSSPGSTIIFLVEYFFTSQVPSDIARDALNKLLNFLIEAATNANTLANPPMPTIVLFPSD